MLAAAAAVPEVQGGKISVYFCKFMMSAHLCLKLQLGVTSVCLILELWQRLG